MGSPKRFCCLENVEKCEVGVEIEWVSKYLY